MPKEGGERQQRTEWHNVVVWDVARKRSTRSPDKGRQIHVEGRIQSRQWRTSKARSATRPTSSRTRSFLGGGAVNPESRSGGEYDRPSGNGAGDFGGGGDFSDDDIPFSYAVAGIE